MINKLSTLFQKIFKMEGDEICDALGTIENRYNKSRWLGGVIMDIRIDIRTLAAFCIELARRVEELEEGKLKNDRIG